MTWGRIGARGMPGASAEGRVGQVPERDLRVSVVIPVRDDAEQLAGCLAALAAQTARIDEIVVVDNASSDDSAAVAVAGGARVVPCDVVGIPAASAVGYDAADGDVILRLDADCRPASDWAATMVAALVDRPEVAAVSGWAWFADGPVLLRRPAAALYLGLYAVLAASALGHAPLFGSNAALRRSAWLEVRDRVHATDAELHDDLDLAFHLGERHRVLWLASARMRMSMRPFAPGRQRVRRLVRGFRTVVVHWPHDFPPHRLARRVGVRAAAAAERRASAREVAA